MIFAQDVFSHVTEGECRKLAELSQGRTVLELGSLYGRSTIAIASVAKIVHSVDWHRGDEHVQKHVPGWGGGSLGPFFENLRRHGVNDRVVAHVGRFEDVLPRLRGPFGVVFVDGFHSADAAQRDCESALSMLASDGCLAVHDYPFFEVAEGLGRIDLLRNGPDELVESLAVYRVKGPHG